MTGIYKIVNNINGKIYIGQSNNLERRKKEHFEWNKNSSQYIDIIIRELGQENFSFEILENCNIKNLTNREKYYINYYDSFYNGYNKTKGGQGEYCGNPKVTKEDVINIRMAYNNKENKKDVYNLYKDKITLAGFSHIWDGSRWKNVMPEVYTEENKSYHRNKAKWKKGELNPYSRLSDKEVIEIRKRYQTETARKIWEDYKDKYSFGSFKHILSGKKYSHLPVYKKTKGEWINVEFNTDN